MFDNDNYISGEVPASEQEETVMQEETATAAEEETAIVVESPTLVKFAVPHIFEGTTYNQIDLAGLETLTAKDMTDAESWLTKKGMVSALPEMTLEYACFIAARASKLPVEFFKSLNPKNAIRVKNKVTSFFYGED